MDVTGSPRGRMVTLLSPGLAFVLPVIETTADFFDGIVRIDGDAERMPYGLQAERYTFKPCSNDGISGGPPPH